MALKLYRPKDFRRDEPTVSINATDFKFNVVASRIANFDDVNWIYIFTNAESREVIFAAAEGESKPTDALKLARGRGHHPHYRHVTAKRLINGTDWLYAAARLPTAQRKFTMSKFEGHMPDVGPDEAGFKVKIGQGWRIQIAPSFERSIDPEAIEQLDASAQGIYRYLDDTGEVIYIGSGYIRQRFSDEVQRRDWGIARIEYSLLSDRGSQYEWENHWLNAFRTERGRLPSFNLVMAPQR